MARKFQFGAKALRQQAKRREGQFIPSPREVKALQEANAADWERGWEISENYEVAQDFEGETGIKADVNTIPIPAGDVEAEAHLEVGRTNELDGNGTATIREWAKVVMKFRKAEPEEPE